MKFNLSQPQRLKAVFIATVLGAAAIEGTVLAQKHHVHTGKDAFLHYQVDSTDELIQALKQNPNLRKEYAQHFGIPEDQVVDFVKRTLVTYRLPAGREVTTYGVTKSGHIYPVHTYLKKGTLVWATRSGLPVLKWACANPLTKHLPGTLLSARPKSTAHSVPRHLPRIASVDSNVLPTDLPSMSVAEMPTPELTAPEATASSALVLPPVLSGTNAAFIPAVAAVSIPVTSSGGHGSSLLPLIPILVGIGSIGHQIGSSPHNGLPPVIVPTPTPGAPGTIPTPAPSGPVSIPTPAPSGPVVVPTPKPSGPVAIPTPTPGAPTAVPTPTPSGPVVIPTPTPSTPPVVPTPTPGSPVLIPTPTPSVPPVVPTPPPYVAPTTTPTPLPTVQPRSPGTPSTTPEPGALALLFLAGLPVVAGFVARRRKSPTA